MIDWKITPAAIYRARKDLLKPVFDIDPITLDDLVAIERQKNILLENTSKFVAGKEGLNALLWGSRGTGKSSLIKALLNEFFNQKLRVIEVNKNDLHVLSDICDEIRDLEYKFIIFCDDLSFEVGDDSYKSLKTIMEGSIELPPKNILVYATSNRRHLLPEYISDNTIKNGEIHNFDAIEERISLADRFGIRLSFYPSTQDEYLKIVDSYFPNIKQEELEQMHAEAKRFAQERASRSGRVAKQFFMQHKDKY